MCIWGRSLAPFPILAVSRWWHRPRQGAAAVHVARRAGGGCLPLFLPLSSPPVHLLLPTSSCMSTSALAASSLPQLRRPRSPCEPRLSLTTCLLRRLLSASPSQTQHCFAEAASTGLTSNQFQVPSQTRRTCSSGHAIVAEPAPAPFRVPCFAPRGAPVVAHLSWRKYGPPCTSIAANATIARGQQLVHRRVASTRRRSWRRWRGTRPPASQTPSPSRTR